MKKVISLWLWCIIALVTFPSLAQISPALWQVEKQGVTSYLLGTMHVGDESMATLPQSIHKAIESSDAIVVEVNLEAIPALQMQQRSLPFLRLENGRSLNTELSDKSYKLLGTYFAEKGINIELFSALKPWAVLMTVMQIEMQNAGFIEQNGIDKQVIQSATRLNKPIIELESLEQQLEMFSAFEEYSDLMVADTFRQLEDFDRYFLGIANSWKAGDMEAFTEIYQDTFDDSEFGQLNEHVLLIERNQNWVKKLTTPLTEQSLFIAVGALHLPEQNGLIALLKKQGFRVTRL
ncbi:TraB/GumN family protein [Pseudoalteromonas pernae]|uniref:TraB/GumN family protein n=1 Tax=Pseudoalteromonas pernae TaxID=3118054 RepID=UPI003242D321